MEPCAPGTEDDPPIMYSTLTKKEHEQERLLSQKAFLKNGKYSNVFDFSIQNGSEHWYCNACECPVMGRVFQHELGKRHAMSISSTHHNVENLKHETSTSESIVEVAPGEPLPPGFEDACRVSIIQERLDGFRFGPLVALEYLIELQDDDPSKEPFYLCILCDKKGDPRTVLTHLASYNHISQYLQKHFPTCWRILAPYNTKQYRRNWQTALQKIAEGIEKKFGRLKPYPIEKDKFDKDRMHYLKIVGKGKHFSEASGYTFEELVVHEELTKNIDMPEDKPYESSAANNWGAATYIEKPFKKRSPSPPVVNMPTKRTKGNAQTNPRKQEPAFSMQPAATNQRPPITKNKEAPQPNRAEPNVQRPPVRRRSLSSLSSLSDRSDTSDKSMRKGRDRFVLRRGGRPQNIDVQLPYGRRRSPRRRSLTRRKSPSLTRRRSPSPRRRSPSPRRRSPIRRRSKSPSFKSEQEKERMRKMEEFKKLARAIENDMFKTLKQHEKNPEKHPQYNEEWKKFWNRRYKELKTEGKDASKYDFKPEWIEFWNKRMVEIHSDELRNRKDALRKRLGLPDEIVPIKFKIGAASNTPSVPEKSTQKPLPMAALPDQDNEVIIIDDKDDDRKQNRSSSWEDEPRGRGAPPRKPRKHSPSPRQRISRERTVTKKSNRSPVRYTRSRSKDRTKDYQLHAKKKSSPVDKRRIKNASPISDFSDSSRDNSRSPSREKSYDRKRIPRESSFERDLRGKERIRTVADLPWERDAMYRSAYLPTPIMRDISRNSDMGPLLDDNDDDVEVNVVDVLRLLTAVEDRLGSLGPKVVDLLAQALAMEKSEANSSEQLLDNEINCVLFETIKEKLKGQMFAGLVDHIQQRAFKKAIKKIASLMHLAGQRKRQRDKLLPKLPAASTTGKVDKAAIAKQIANALILQGKTDVTQAELEQLINAVVGMAEASKIASKPVTTAGFLNMIGGNESDKKETKNNVIDLEKLTEPLTPSPGKTPINNMENLSDSDLQTLLQNFKDLSTEEQHNLINYLRKLEYQEPERVEKLRKFVNLDPNSKPKDESVDSVKDTSNEDTGMGDSSNKSRNSERDSPFSRRIGDNLANDELEHIESEEEKEADQNNENKGDAENDKPDKKVNVDSEEDEYSFEDVVKSVSKNVKEKEMEESKKVVEETMKYDNTRSNLTNAKDLISQLMSNITKNNSTTSKNIDLLGLGQPVSNNVPSTNTMDLSRLLNINVASLASIVNNVKSMSSNENNENQLNFRPPPSTNQTTLNFDLTQLKPDPLKFGQNSGPIDRDHFDINRPADIPGRSFQGGPNRNDGPRGPDVNRLPFRNESDRFGPGGPDRFGPGGPDRFGPGGPDRFGAGVPDRFGPGGPDRFGVGGPDRFGPGGPDRFGPGGPDRFGPAGLDRQRPVVPDRLGPGGADRFGLGGPDRIGPSGGDRLGPGGPDRFGLGGVDRFGPGPDRFGLGPDRFGPGPDTAALGGPGRLGFEERGFGGPDRLGSTGLNRPPLGLLGAPGLNTATGPRMMGGRLGGPGNFGTNTGTPFDSDTFNKPRLSPGDQRNFPRLPPPDFSKSGGNNKRW